LRSLFAAHKNFVLGRNSHPLRLLSAPWLENDRVSFLHGQVRYTFAEFSDIAS